MISRAHRHITMALMSVALLLTSLTFTSPAANASHPARKATKLTLTATKTVKYHSKTHLAGRLTRSGNHGIGGRTIAIYRRTHGTTAWHKLANARTNSHGAYAYNAAINANTDLRAVAAQTKKYKRATSPTRTTTLRPAITLNGPVDILADTDIEVGGFVKPARNGRLVKLQYNNDGTWHTFDSVPMDNAGHYRDPIQFTGVGPLKLRALITGTADLLGAASSARTVNVIDSTPPPAPPGGPGGPPGPPPALRALRPNSTATTGGGHTLSETLLRGPATRASLSVGDPGTVSRGSISCLDFNANYQPDHSEGLIAEDFPVVYGQTTNQFLALGSTLVYWDSGTRTWKWGSSTYWTYSYSNPAANEVFQTWHDWNTGADQYRIRWTVPGASAAKNPYWMLYGAAYLWSGTQWISAAVPNDGRGGYFTPDYSTWTWGCVYNHQF